ncbi:MAG: hypothetical protein HGGPFJEG_00491 [Ignavibacteria bacterium]|nr:hypothetical protein [Ignavibacteria bacterium]
MEIVEILDNDYLIRRIPLNNPDYLKPDGTICSYAFKPKKKSLNEISVNIKKLTTYIESVIDSESFGLLQLTAKVIRENSLDCIHSPESTNYSHASVKGQFTNSVCKNLAKSSNLINESDF